MSKEHLARRAGRLGVVYAALARGLVAAQEIARATLASCILLGVVVIWTPTLKLRQSLMMMIRVRSYPDGLDASDVDSVQSDSLSVASETEADVLEYQTVRAPGFWMW